MAIYVYDPKDLAFMLDSVDYTEELGLEPVEFDVAESLSVEVALAGKPLFHKNKEDLHVKVKITVQKKSPLNEKLYEHVRTSTPFSMSITDMNINESTSSKECLVLQKPKPKHGDNSDLEWEFYATYYKRDTLGGSA